MSRFLTEEKFRELARAGKADASQLSKQYIAEVKVQDDAARELLFTISTGAVDRQRDKINVDGWRLDAYRKNPVVLWAHDYSDFPVARSKQIWTEDGKLKSIAAFVPADNPATGKHAEGIYQLYKQGFMSATSVGFMPIKWAWTEDKERGFGIDFEEQELLEWSLVPVPANAEALIEARGLGIDIEPLKDWARGILVPSGGINTLRELEMFLRDAGLSRTRAAELATLGFKEAARRDAEAEACASLDQQFKEMLKPARRF